MNKCKPKSTKVMPSETVFTPSSSKTYIEIRNTTKISIYNHKFDTQSKILQAKKIVLQIYPN